MLTIAEIRELIESDASDISDVALQVFIDEAEADLLREIGPEDDSERFEVLDGGFISVFVSRRVAAVDSIQERVFLGDYVGVADDDYDFKSRRLRKLGGSYWLNQVKVTYTPVAEIPQRKAIVSRLVALAASFSPYSSTNTGGVSKSTREYVEQKELVLADARGIRGAVLGV